MQGTTYRISRLRYQAAVVYQCSKDTRVSWWNRLYCFCTSYYVLGEMDLVPDFIPFIGHIDDLIIMPSFLNHAQKVVGKDIYEENNLKSKTRHIDANIGTYLLDVIYTIIWLLVIYFVILRIIIPFFNN